MTTSQLLLYGVLVLLILIYLRRFFLTRSVTRYSPAQLADRMKEGNMVLLDVRTNGEFQSGHIKGALHIPVMELTARVAEIKKQGDREIVCYCQSGSRSLMAAARLTKLGFRSSHLEGGIAEWNFSQR